MSVSSPAQLQKPLLSNQAYTFLKHIASIMLPALGTLYFTMAQIWNLPKPEAVIGTIAAVNTFLGVLMGFSSATYNKSDAKYAGKIVVSDDGTKKLYSLELNADPTSIDLMKEVTFKVAGN